MTPALLTELIVIEREAETVRPDGGLDRTWSEIARTRAELSERTMAEVPQERGTLTVTTLTFKARWVPGITLADRILYGDLHFNISAVTEIGRRDGLEIKCKRTGQ